MAPAEASRASARWSCPAPWWPTRATLRIDDGGRGSHWHLLSAPYRADRPSVVRAAEHRCAGACACLGGAPARSRVRGGPVLRPPAGGQDEAGSGRRGPGPVGASRRGRSPRSGPSPLTGGGRSETRSQRCSTAAGAKAVDRTTGPVGQDAASATASPPTCSPPRAWPSPWAPPWRSATGHLLLAIPLLALTGLPRPAGRPGGQGGGHGLGARRLLRLGDRPGGRHRRHGWRGLVPGVGPRGPPGPAARWPSSASARSSPTSGPRPRRSASRPRAASWSGPSG